MDPFFAAQSKRNGNPWGKHPGYVEDVYRTYGGGKLPQRDPKMFERAMQFREKEKAEWAQVRKDRDMLGQLLANNTTELNAVSGKLEELTLQYSKLKEEHGRAIADRDRSSGVRGVPDAKSADGVAPSGDDRVPGEVLPADGVPSAGGPSSEHSDEGRHAGGADDGGGVPVREEPVQEGGD